tara:strand:- start:150 stop:860 length:711 start_codon:yes stop_codon:yes gene_type:complete
MINEQQLGSNQYSIGIVTFEKRFETYFKPLLSSIKKYRPDIEITVCVNGEYKNKTNQEYSKQILSFCSEYSNVYPQLYIKFNSLAKLWNRAVINSTNNLVLVLNDDIQVTEEFFDLLDSLVPKCKGKITLFNRIFSHFVVDRELLNELNWFDERFLGVGKEDRDIQQKIQCHNITTPTIDSRHIETTQPIPNMKTYGGKYTKFNDIFFTAKHHEKKEPEQLQYPYYSFEVENYDKL